MSCSTLVCFDLDGVLLDSEPVKLAAWDDAVADVLAPDRATRAALSRYNRQHRGVPRRHKFTHAAQVCGSGPRQIGTLEAVYAARLAAARPAAAPGARHFLASCTAATAVITSAPRSEAVRNLGRLGLGPFDHVSDGSTAKTIALERCTRSYRHVLFFGDAPADRTAARVARVAFVAIGTALPAHPLDAGHALDLRDTRLLRLIQP